MELNIWPVLRLVLPWFLELRARAWLLVNRRASMDLWVYSLPSRERPPGLYYLETSMLFLVSGLYWLVGEFILGEDLLIYGV